MRRDGRKQSVGVAAARLTLLVAPSPPDMHTARLQEVVDESVSQLLLLAAARKLPGLDAAGALQALLSALEFATARTAPLLAQGAVEAFLLRQTQQQQQPPAVAATAAAAGSGSEAWSRHALSAALLAHPAGAQQLLARAVAALEPGRSGGCGSSTSLTDTWQQLAPFFSFVLLRSASDAGAGGGGSSSKNAAAAGAGGGAGRGQGGTGDRLDPLAAAALRGALVGALVRAACGAADVARLVVPFLLRHLAVAPLGDETTR